MRTLALLIAAPALAFLLGEPAQKSEIEIFVGSANPGEEATFVLEGTGTEVTVVSAPNVRTTPEGPVEISTPATLSIQSAPEFRITFQVRGEGSEIQLERRRFQAAERILVGGSRIVLDGSNERISVAQSAWVRSIRSPD